MTAALEQSEPSFAEQAHRVIVDALTPTEASNRMLQVIEGTIATAGTLLYHLAPDGTLTGLGGAFDEVFRSEPWFLEDDPCRHPAHHDLGPNILYATRLVDWRTHERSVAYREFYGPRNIAHVACMALGTSPRDHATKLGLFLGRRESSGDFTTSDESSLAASLPLLTALCRASGEWGATERWLATLVDGAEPRSDDAGETAVLVFSSSGACLWRSRRAAEYLAALSLGERDRLLARLMEQIYASVESNPRLSPFTIRVALPDGRGRRLEVEIERHLRSANSSTFVVRFDPRASFDPAARAIERYGLTPTESRVLECLAEGLSNREIAERLDIATATAATYVKRILSKLSVSSRLKAGLLMQRILLGGGP